MSGNVTTADLGLDCACGLGEGPTWDAGSARAAVARRRRRPPPSARRRWRRIPVVALDRRVTAVVPDASSGWVVGAVRLRCRASRPLRPSWYGGRVRCRPTATAAPNDARCDPVRPPLGRHRRPFRCAAGRAVLRRGRRHRDHCSLTASGCPTGSTGVPTVASATTSTLPPTRVVDLRTRRRTGHAQSYADARRVRRDAQTAVTVDPTAGSGWPCGTAARCTATRLTVRLDRRRPRSRRVRVQLRVRRRHPVDAVHHDGAAI